MKRARDIEWRSYSKWMYWYTSSSDSESSEVECRRFRRSVHRRFTNWPSSYVFLCSLFPLIFVPLLYDHRFSFSFPVSHLLICIYFIRTPCDCAPRCCPIVLCKAAGLTDSLNINVHTYTRNLAPEKESSGFQGACPSSKRLYHPYLSKYT